MASYYIGLDVGGTLVKAAVFDKTGAQRAVLSGETRLDVPRPGFTQRDMDELYAVAARLIREALARAKADPKDVACVACCGHGKGLYAVDDSGNAFMPGILSTDTRAHAVVSRWRRDGTQEAAYPATLQAVTAPQPAALLRWLKENDRARYDRIGCVFEAKDYLRFRLTGEARAEYTDFSGTSLLNLTTRAFDGALLRLFGIGEMARALPPLSDSCALCGFVTPEAARLTGLLAGTPVAGGLFDIDACALACGVSNADEACVIAGTWSINEYISEEPVAFPGAPMNSLFCDGKHYLVEASSPTSAGNLAWLSRRVFDCDRASAEARGASVYREFDALAARADPTSNVYYLPYIYGSQSDPRARAAFFGLSSADGKGEMLRAALEGVAFNHRLHLDDLLCARDGRPFSVARLAGGATKSPLWVGLFADILGLPVEISECGELGALGCAICAATASGAYPDVLTAARAMTRVAERVEPDPERAALYEKKLIRFKALKAASEGLLD